MLRFGGLCFGMPVRVFRGRQSLFLENLALRQQLSRDYPSEKSAGARHAETSHTRPCLGLFDKFFWVVALPVRLGRRHRSGALQPRGEDLA
jgi:hypothetical protein